MSSAPTVASPSASTSSNPTSQPTATNNASVRATMRSSNQVKNNDGTRRQSPTDTASRRPPTQKAWASGANPLTQRSSSAVQSNGVAAPSKPPPNLKMNPQKESGLSDKQAHDRLIFILGAAIGLNVVLTTRAGDKFEGLMAGSSVAAGNTRISLKMVKKLQQTDTGHANGAVAREAALTGTSPEHAVTLDVRDITDLLIPEFSMPESTRMANGTASKFQTDADISGNQSRSQRTLQPWVPDGPDTANYSLESDATGEWDQFATNRQLFNTQSTYDENFYTIALDRNSESYRVREANAAKIAREIEGTQSTNVHLREERGHVAENDGDDEEAKYSGVRREDLAFPPLPIGGPNKYTPPARRAPTGQPTVAGAPVDPAIVSAQLSRPDNKPSSQTQLQKPTPTDTKPREKTVGGEVESQKPTEPETKDASDKDRALNASTSPNFISASGHTEGVETKVLQQFRQFADAEKQKLVEKKRAQASQDKTAKLNELLRFSRNFKLKTPIPTDLVGILAKDPVKQEAIIEKAKREHEESTSAATSPSAPAATEPANRKAELPQIAGIPDRQTFNRARGGFPQAAGRPDRAAPAQGMFPGRTANIPQRPGLGQQDRKPSQPHSIPAPIPILDGRQPPTGPMADQAPLASPQRSNLQTPTSATSSSKFNLNAQRSRS